MYNMDWAFVGRHVQVQHAALVETRIGAAQSPVDRYVQMQHKAVGDQTRNVQHRQRYSPGAAQAAAAISHAPPSIAQATVIQLSTYL
jgi:hypothetical protein